MYIHTDNENVRVYICTYVRTYKRMYIHVYVCMCIRTYIHIYVRMYTHMYSMYVGACNWEGLGLLLPSKAGI